jgi:hypothetical protein
VSATNHVFVVECRRKGRNLSWKSTAGAWRRKKGAVADMAVWAARNPHFEFRVTKYVPA